MAQFCSVFAHPTEAKRLLISMISVSKARLSLFTRSASQTPPHVIEAILNHKSGQVSGIAAVYNRHDYFEEKAQALVAWNRFLEIICDDKMRALYDRMRTSVRRREGIGHDRAVRYRDLLLKSLHGDEQQWQRTLRRARIAGALTHD